MTNLRDYVEEYQQRHKDWIKWLLKEYHPDHLNHASYKEGEPDILDGIWIGINLGCSCGQVLEITRTMEENLQMKEAREKRDQRRS